MARSPASPGRLDPLALDLNGDGLHTTPMFKTPAVLSDADGDLIKTTTAWLNANDGLLALDRNGNGRIDNDGELFGDQIVLSSAASIGHDDALPVRQGSFTCTDGSEGETASFLFGPNYAVHEFVPIKFSTDAQTQHAIAGAG